MWSYPSSMISPIVSRLFDCPYPPLNSSLKYSSHHSSPSFAACRLFVSSIRAATGFWNYIHFLDFNQLGGLQLSWWSFFVFPQEWLSSTHFGWQHVTQYRQLVQGSRFNRVIQLPINESGMAATDPHWSTMPPRIQGQGMRQVALLQLRLNTCGTSYDSMWYLISLYFQSCCGHFIIKVTKSLICIGRTRGEPGLTLGVA